VFYLPKIDALVTAVIFSAAGLIILTLLVWCEAKTYAAAQFRIYKRLASFANPLAISRSVSRFDGRDRFTPHKIQ